jgi:TolA-binding protein
MGRLRERRSKVEGRKLKVLLLTALGFGLMPAATRAAAPAQAQPAPKDAAGTAKKDVAPGTTSKSRFLDGMGRTADEEHYLDEISRALESYEREAKDFRREVQLLVEKKYEEKRNTLSNSYEKAIRDLEVVERKERLDAIAQFEEFLTRYPDDPKYTPDVMFRLAELLYERASDDQVVAMREFEERIRSMEAEKSANPPPEPLVDFSRSIALYRKLITHFPSYRLNDGAYYLLGYCLEKQNEFEKSREAYQQLIARYRPVILREIDDAVAFAEASPWPGREELLAHVI